MPDTKTRLLAAVKNGDTKVAFGRVVAMPSPAGDFFRVEVAGDQPEGFKWDESAGLSWWEGALIDDAVAKIDAALAKAPVKGASLGGEPVKKITIQAEGISSVTDLIGITKPVEVTENYVRIRARDPDDFEEGTFRTVDLSKEKGIKTVMGRLKGEKTMTIQTYLFDKDKWTKEQAREWVKAQKKEMPDEVQIEKALLPIADKGGGWDADAAIGRLRKWASDGSADKDKMDWGKYGRAFLYVDPDDKEGFGGYKLPFADVVDGTLKAVPEGIYAAARAVLGARTPMKVPLEKPRALIASYYEKMGEEAPWKREKELSMSEQERQIRDAFMQKFGGAQPAPEDFYVREVFEDYLIASFKGGLYKFPFVKAGDRTSFPFGEWEEVKMAYVPVVTQEKKEPVMKMALAVAKALLKRQDSATAVWKEDNVKYYMALISMSIFDEEGQIVEKEGMDCSIALSQKHGYKSGLYIRHVVPQSLVGRCMYERRIGPYWVEVGKFRDSLLSEETYRILEKDDKGEWKLSIGFITTKDQAEKGRYTRLLKYDTTITDRPALPVTAVLAVGGKTEMDAIAKLLSFLNPESEEEKEKATAMLGELFGLEEKELATVIKESEEVAAVKAAISALTDEGLKKRLLGVLAAGTKPEEEKKETEPVPVPDEEPDLSATKQLIEDAVTAAMTGVADRLTALEARPGAADAVKEIGDLLRKRSQDVPRPTDNAPIVEGVSDLVDKIDKHIGEKPGPKHPLAGFSGGPSALEGG